MKYTDKNKPLVCTMTQSTCYKGTRKFTPKGILWHSTGANNPWLKRYVQPDDNAKNRTELLNKLGKNSYNNDWNHIYHEAGLNFWIGKLADGTVAAVQTMDTVRKDVATLMGGSSGGGGNSNKDTLYRVRKTWADAKSQKGAYKVLDNAKKCADKNPGYSVFDGNGKSVYTSDSSTPVTPSKFPYLVKVKISDLNYRKGPGTNYASYGFIKPGVYTIVDEQNGWGLLKAYADKRNGWIYLGYTEKV